MSPRHFKALIYLLEALNGLGTTWYFFYLYFFTEARFGFGKLQNFLLAAGIGLLYAVASVWGGRFAQRHGSLNALKLGFAGMAASLAVGSEFTKLSSHLVVMATCTASMALTWPALQALVSEGESRVRLQRSLGIYNLVWSGCGAVAYFTGGAMIEAWGLRSLFVVPGVIHLVQLALTLFVASRFQPSALRSTNGSSAAELPPVTTSVSPRTFLRMAWLANPFAYLAINTVVSVSPSLARTLELTPRYAGYYCSIWMFTRTASFLLFWLWPGWHYRFRWLVNAYIGMVLAFLVILLAPNISTLILAQLGFGVCLGLIYYSSLFYSMDVGETKGEHGGIHEAAIGAGSCAGPAVGALALYLVPGQPYASAVGVGLLLLGGLGGLIWLRRKPPQPPARPEVTA